MDDIAFRRAEGADAPFIAELFCTGFSPAVAELLIYGCSGAANYIRMQIASHALHSASAYFVAHTSDHVLAAVELRLAPDRLFLNYIGVHCLASTILPGQRQLFFPIGDNYFQRSLPL